jgi:hypothetical protein
MSENYLNGVDGRIKGGTQFGTQKCVGRSVKAVDAMDAERSLLSNFVSVATTGARALP